MSNFKKISKILLIATSLSGVIVTSSLVPTVAELTGQRAFAQDLPVASPERAAIAQAARDARPRASSTTSVGERVGKILIRANDMINAEPPQYEEAKVYLEGQNNIERWNPTERANYFQMMASVNQATDNLDQAVVFFKMLLDMDTISYTLRDQLTFAVGQIEFSNGNKEEGLRYVYDWFQYQPNPSISQLEFLANIHFSLGQDEDELTPSAEKNFRLSVEFLNWAIVKAKAEEKPDKENWYQVLRALHNSLEETDKVLEYAELLATRWSKKDYWKQLSNLYAQAGGEEGISEAEVQAFEKKQLAAMELVHRQGLLEEGRELETMAQLYLYHDSPYQASKTMAKSFDEGLSEQSQRNLELLATSYVNGKDLEDSVEPLTKAAELSDTGDIYMRLANVYLNIDNYEAAAAAITSALDKGGLRRPDQSRLLQGQAYLALEMFDEARNSFREAAKEAADERTETSARSLLRYVDSEEKRINDIKEYLS